MDKGKNRFDWQYLFEAEDASTHPRSRLAGACKTFIWLGISILMGIGVAQLT